MGRDGRRKGKTMADLLRSEVQRVLREELGNFKEQRAAAEQQSPAGAGAAQGDSAQSRQSSGNGSGQGGSGQNGSGAGGGQGGGQQSQNQSGGGGQQGSNDKSNDVAKVLMTDVELNLLKLRQVIQESEALIQRMEIMRDSGFLP